jgi:hypothetical protein
MEVGLIKIIAAPREAGLMKMILARQKLDSISWSKKRSTPKQPAPKRQGHVRYPI